MDWDVVIREVKENKRNLAIMSAIVFVVSFLLVLLLRGCGGSASGPPSSGTREPETARRPVPTFAGESRSGILDSKLPVSVPYADFNRSLSGGTVQLVRRTYRLTGEELRRPAGTNAAPPASDTNQPPPRRDSSDGKKTEQPEIDMILNRPAKKPLSRSPY